MIGLPEEWGICGCANEPALRLLRDILRVMAEDGPGICSPQWNDWVSEHIARRTKIAGGTAQWELFMHYIEKMGWSEHGGGINSSWLSAKGEEALAILEKLPLEDE